MLRGNAQDAGIDPGMSGLRARVQGHVPCRNQAAGKVDLFAVSRRGREAARKRSCGGSSPGSRPRLWSVPLLRLNRPERKTMSEPQERPLILTNLKPGTAH